MTQQYLIGQFSVLLEDLQPPPGDLLAGTVRDLRQEVESCPVQMLAALAHEALELTDVICWAALARGDCSGFGHYAEAGVALGDFADSAGFVSR
jgi:hypothetical protein